MRRVGHWLRFSPKAGFKIGAHYLNVSKSCQDENENRFQIEVHRGQIATRQWYGLTADRKEIDRVFGENKSRKARL
jgi:hypothetical protein